MDVPRLSPAEIVADLDASLANLQTDVIDLYWLHRDDEQRPVGEILETLEAQRRAGKIRAYGCSNWRTPRIQAAGAYATEHSLPGFAADQMMWSYAAIDPSALGDPSMVVMDDDLYTYHVESRLAAIPYSSQARGFFQKLAAGRVRKDDAGLRPYAGKANRRRLERLRRLAAATGHTITGLALAYLTSQPFVTVPIIGSRTEAQLVDSLQAAEIELAPREVAYLEQA
jgi:aryl-alcohol dehydrogenase-like predicted oxidoreductase